MEEYRTEAELRSVLFMVRSFKVKPFLDLRVGSFSWEEKLVAPLIATPNVDKAIEDKLVP